MKIISYLFCIIIFIFSACKEKDETGIFLGQYYGIETCQGGSDDFFEISIIKEGPSTLRIENFADFDIAVIAEVNDDDFIIEKQNIGNYSIEGSGTVFGNSLIIVYEFKVDVTTVNCNFIGNE